MPPEETPESIKALAQNSHEEENKRLKKQLAGYKSLASMKKGATTPGATPATPPATPQKTETTPATPAKKGYLAQCEEVFKAHYEGRQ